MFGLKFGSLVCVWIIMGSKLNFCTNVIYLNKSKTYLRTQPWPLSCMNFLWCKQLHNNSSNLLNLNHATHCQLWTINLSKFQESHIAFYTWINSIKGGLQKKNKNPKSILLKKCGFSRGGGRGSCDQFQHFFSYFFFRLP